MQKTNRNDNDITRRMAGRIVGLKREVKQVGELKERLKLAEERNRYWSANYETLYEKYITQRDELASVKRGTRTRVEQPPTTTISLDELAAVFRNPFLTPTLPPEPGWQNPAPTYLNPEDLAAVWGEANPTGRL